MLRALDVGVSSGGSPSFTDLTVTNDLIFTGGNNRILGDFSLDPTAVLFQNSAIFGNTFVGTIPNATGGLQSGFAAYGNATLATASYGLFTTLASTAVFINSAHNGAGSTLPIRFAIDGSYVSEITTAGNFLFGTVIPTAGNEKVQINGSLSINSAVMIRSYTAFTDGAGVGAGTLTNAPAAGDPTKWIPVNDNGTTRFIPAW